MNPLFLIFFIFIFIIPIIFIFFNGSRGIIQTIIPLIITLIVGFNVLTTVGDVLNESNATTISSFDVLFSSQPKNDQTLIIEEKQEYKGPTEIYTDMPKDEVSHTGDIVGVLLLILSMIWSFVSIKKYIKQKPKKRGKK